MKKLLMSVAMVALLSGCVDTKWSQGRSEEVYVDDKPSDVTWVPTGENQFELIVKTWYWSKLVDPLYERDRGRRASGIVVGRLCGAAREPQLLEQAQMGESATQNVYRYKCVLPNSTVSGPSTPSQPITVNVNANPVITVNVPGPVVPPPKAPAASAEAAPPSDQKSEAPKAQ